MCSVPGTQADSTVCSAVLQSPGGKETSGNNGTHRKGKPDPSTGDGLGIAEGWATIIVGWAAIVVGWVTVVVGWATHCCGLDYHCCGLGYHEGHSKAGASAQLSQAFIQAAPLSRLGIWQWLSWVAGTRGSLPPPFGKKW